MLGKLRLEGKDYLVNDGDVKCILILGKLKLKKLK